MPKDAEGLCFWWPYELLENDLVEFFWDNLSRHPQTLQPNHWGCFLQSHLKSDSQLILKSEPFFVHTDAKALADGCGSAASLTHQSYELSRSTINAVKLQQNYDCPNENNTSEPSRNPKAPPN